MPIGPNQQARNFKRLAISALPEVRLLAAEGRGVRIQNGLIRSRVRELARRL